MNCAGEEIGYGREIPGGRRGTCLPYRRDTPQRRGGGLVLHTEQADLGQVSLGYLLFGIGDMSVGGKTGKRHFHIGLPGGKPHVAHQQVRTGELGAAMDGKRERAAGRLRREPRLPQAQVVCRGGDGLAVES